MTWDELCEQIEALIVEHGQMIFEHNMAHHELEEETPPNWGEGIMALLDWTLTFSIKDTGTEGGNWIMFLEPTNQPPYRGDGLLHARLKD